MESMLYEAALEGSVATLFVLLQQDPLILDRVAMNNLSETPLHVAALLGHVDFVKEILRRKPELAGELDSRKFSALHIASQKGYVDMVKALLQANPDMCFARDVDGKNPLHLAAMNGRIDVLRELVRTRLPAASSTTIWGETILHLCVKYNQLEALKFLLENMDDPEFLNAKDDYGMTVLHLAVVDKQIEVIKFLTTRTTINVNALNASGFTALDVLAQSKRDVKDWAIGESIRRAGGISAKDHIHLSTYERGATQTKSLASHENNQKQQGNGLENVHKKREDWLEKMSSALMVVASLIATMAFQGAMDPPWKETCKYQGADCIHRYPFISFSITNTIGFMASLSIILLLVSGLPLRRRLFMWILMVIVWVAIIAMGMTYLFSTDFFIYQVGYYSDSVTLLWIMILVAILLLGHMIRIIVIMVKYIRNLVRRLRKNKALDAHEPRPVAPIV